MKRYKVVFADLDDTLITTISGETFPKGVWDMKIKFDVLDKLKQLKPKVIYIVSNQGGISQGFVNEFNFRAKIDYVAKAIREYTDIPVHWDYCPSNDKNNPYRKPNTGSLVFFNEIYVDRVDAHYHEILMIGDASGKEGQFSDSDKKCAENYGIDYLDVDDFLNAEF